MKRLFLLLLSGCVWLCPLQAQQPVDIFLTVEETGLPEGERPGQLLNITFNNYILCTFFFDRDSTDGAILSLMQAASVQQHSFRFPAADSAATPGLFDFHFHFSADEAACTVRAAGDSCRFENIVLNPRNLQVNPLPDGRTDLRMVALRVGRDHPQPTAWPATVLVAVILLGDLLLFVSLYSRKRKQRTETPQKAVPISARRYVPSERNARSGIYLFGGFRVLAADGTDISTQFSPILRELLLLLVCHTPKGGISSEQIKDILWYDKDEKSAGNNRSVSLFKLRKLLREVGPCEIRSDQGRWTLEAPAELVDYYRFVALVRSGSLTRSQLEELLTLVEYGPLLEGFDELWADALKADVTDSILTVLTQFALQTDPHSQAALLLDVCDAIFKFDPLNETALSLKCRALREKGNNILSRQVFSNFQKEYLNVYGEPFPREYGEVISS